MDQIYGDEGLVFLLLRCVTPSWKYHLYVNNLTPTLSTGLSSFTEAAWPGYAPIVVPASAFTFQNVIGHVGSIQAANILFSNGDSVPHSAYGYYVTDASDTQYITCAKFDLAPVVIPPGGTLPVVPAHGDFSGLDS